MDKIYTVSITKVRRGPLGGDDVIPERQVDRLDIDVENHPSPEEKASMGEAIGSNREPDTVEPEPQSAISQSEEAQDERPVKDRSSPTRWRIRSREELMPNDRIPSVYGGAFERWYDDLSAGELEGLMRDYALERTPADAGFSH